MPPNTRRMTTVRMNVARSGSMLATPTLAKIAVSAAKAADNRAHTIQAGRPKSGMACTPLCGGRHDLHGSHRHSRERQPGEDSGKAPAGARIMPRPNHREWDDANERWRTIEPYPPGATGAALGDGGDAQP